MHGERLQSHAAAIADTLSSLKDIPDAVTDKLEEQVRGLYCVATPA